MRCLAIRWNCSISSLFVHKLLQPVSGPCNTLRLVDVSCTQHHLWKIMCAPGCCVSINPVPSWNWSKPVTTAEHLTLDLASVSGFFDQCEKDFVGGNSSFFCPRCRITAHRCTFRPNASSDSLRVLGTEEIPEGQHTFKSIFFWFHQKGRLKWCHSYLAKSSFFRFFPLHFVLDFRGLSSELLFIWAMFYRCSLSFFVVVGWVLCSYIEEITMYSHIWTNNQTETLQKFPTLKNKLKGTHKQIPVNYDEP